MKYSYNLTIIFFLIFFFFNSASSHEKIAYVDIDYIIQNSIIGKKKIDLINKNDKKNLEILKKKNKTLKDLELSIKKKENIISDEEYKKEVLAFKKKVSEFTNEKNKIVKDFNIFKKNEFQNIFEKINPIINQYMEKNSISILLDSKNVFIGNRNSNLTENLLKVINEKLK